MDQWKCMHWDHSIKIMNNSKNTTRFGFVGFSDLIILVGSETLRIYYFETFSFLFIEEHIREPLLWDVPFYVFFPFQIFWGHYSFKRKMVFHELVWCSWIANMNGIRICFFFTIFNVPIIPNHSHSNRFFNFDFRSYSKIFINNDGEILNFLFLFITMQGANLSLWFFFFVFERTWFT